MGATEVDLAAGHLAGCLKLSAAAGWNQNEADWRLMLRIGRGWGLTEADGTLAASTLVLPYGDFAWISMVLVLPEYRRRGHATRLLRNALEYLKTQNLIPVLDATPAGREVYRQEGFRDTWTFKRHVTEGGGPIRDRVRPLRDTDWPWILELDRAAFGGDRESLLRSLAGRLPAAALVADGQGFILGRDGRERLQLGPLVARDAGVARTLFEAARGRLTGPLYLDIADHASLGGDFAVQRPFTRMVHGTAPVPGETAKVHLVAGPELG